ncbi:MAG: hypothetical protein J5529_12195 [Prevotella sp.]|nr:hypothetical protein [Prevotella sp.]
MNKTEDILNRLQGLQPVIDNPDELTERIMESLPDMDESKGKGMAVIKVLRIISSIAAVWLIGLFIHYHAPMTPFPHQSGNINPYYTSNLSSGNTLKNVYTGALRQKDSKQLSYTHLRKMLYENK